MPIKITVITISIIIISCYSNGHIGDLPGLFIRLKANAMKSSYGPKHTKSWKD